MFKKPWKPLCVAMLSIAVIMSPLNAFACEDADDESHTFNVRQTILPLSLMAVGTFGVYNGYFRHINNSVKNGMDHIRGDHYFRIDDNAQYLPIIAYVGLDYIGVRAKHSLRERVAVGITSYITMAAIVNATKYTIKEKRPDSSARQSFPSGHTATVFTGAELIREEYGTVPGIAAYSIATGVAFLRLYNGRHWMNDVIAGAGVGILSARIGYWMLPLYQKWFGWDNGKSSRQAAIVPSFDPANSFASINLVCVF